MKNALTMSLYVLTMPLCGNPVPCLFDFPLQHAAIEHNASATLKRELRQKRGRIWDSREKLPTSKAEYLEYGLVSYHWRSLDLEKPIFEGALRVVLINEFGEPRVARSRLQGNCIFIDDDMPQEAQYWAYDLGAE